MRGGETAQVARHASEERSHIKLWNKFGQAPGLSSKEFGFAPANPATTKLLQRGDEMTANDQAAAVVLALESQTPAVAAGKLAGLSAYYGVGEDVGGEYFALHQQLDVEHSAELRTLCGDGSQDAAAVISEALWDLLTSMEAAPEPV